MDASLPVSDTRQRQATQTHGCPLCGGAPSYALQKVYAQSAHPKMVILQERRTLPEMSWRESLVQKLTSHELPRL
jgi:hypothetical protein